MGILEDMEEIVELAHEYLEPIDNTKLSNCCDAHFVPETDICSDCKEHAGHYFDREPLTGEMICPECGESIVPIGDDGAFDYAGTHCNYGKAGTHIPHRAIATCPKCDECCEGDDFDEWVSAQNYY